MPLRTCAQPVGLQHVGGGQGFEEGEAFLQRVGGDALVAGGGDAVAHHEVLGKVLASLQLRAGLRGADDADVARRGVGLQEVGNAVHQRVFGAHDNHVDVVGQRHAAHRFEVGGLDVDVDARKDGAGVARGDEELVDAGALGYFPCQGAFAAART